jgi:hypothetical protein
MSDGPDSVRPRGGVEADEDPRAVERRIRRDMCVAVALAAVASVLFAPWRVTAGLLLGGALSLFNFHWLSASVASLFETAPAGGRRGLGVARYVLRYFVVGAAVAVAYWLDFVSVVAVLAGMCSFAAAALAEGFRQLFLIAGREDN